MLTRERSCMPTIGLIALIDIHEHGVSAKAGEYFTTSPIISLALTYRKKARFSSKPEPRKKRAYRRRDLVAEQIETAGE